MAQSFDEEPDFDIAYDPSDEVERIGDEDDDYDDNDYDYYPDEDEWEDDDWDDEDGDWDFDRRGYSNFPDDL